MSDMKFLKWIWVGVFNGDLLIFKKFSFSKIFSSNINLFKITYIMPQLILIIFTNLFTLLTLIGHNISSFSRLPNPIKKILNRFYRSRFSMVTFGIQLQLIIIYII